MSELTPEAEAIVAAWNQATVRAGYGQIITCDHHFPDGARCTQSEFDHLHQKPKRTNGRIDASCRGRHHRFAPNLGPFFEALGERGFSVVPKP